jgi:repressor LexA
MLNVKGESMINSGIFDGDLVIVRKQSDAQNGDIVVALIENEATVKKLFKSNNYVRLQPENDSFEPIIINSTQELRILGKVIGLIRKI